MSTPYERRLKAIRKMLSDPSREVVHEGYSLLFDLWLENVDASGFQQELVLIAVANAGILQEFGNRINELVIREGITDVYLRLRLSKLASAVEEQKENPQPMSPKKLFISYSHKDESFKDELITMLAGLQRQGVIDPWQDRRIEAGTEWLDAICQAMEDCHIALLLVSPDFIASPFIQNQELTRLFQRRLNEGLRVLPIIVRPSLWQKEPVIRDLQVIPKDGRAVISFSKDNGDRDQVWADIGRVIESLAQKL